MNEAPTEKTTTTTTITFSTEVWTRLAREAKRTGVSRSDLVRLAVMEKYASAEA